MDEYNTLVDTIKMLAEAVKRHDDILREYEKIIKEQENHILHLYQNANVLSGWHPRFNKEKIDYLIECNTQSGVTEIKREKKLIVSLTSYPARMYDIKYTLFSLLNQSLKPDMVILWLGKEQFPNGYNDIAPSILRFQQQGLTIEFCEDIKSYKKLIPSLEKYPDDIIITADDDIYYPDNWLEQLYESYLQAPDLIHCHRAHQVGITDGGKIASYNMW